MKRNGDPLGEPSMILSQTSITRQNSRSVVKQTIIPSIIAT